jgi:ABC-type polysaccharide/polyol phosphate export permease
VTSLKAYAKGLWAARHFWLMLARLDLQARYRRSSLGIGWSLLHPIAMTGVLCFVFHRILKQDIVTYAPFLMVGLSFWTFLCHVVLQGCLCFTQSQQYMRQHPLPAATYALRTALTGAFHFAIAVAVVVAFSWCTRGFSNVPYLPAVLPVLALLFLFGWSLAILSGLCSVFFPDTIHLIDIVLRMAFYLTPVLYPPEILRGRGFDWFVAYNPLAACLELLRAPLLSSQWPSMPAMCTAIAGMAFFSITATLALAKLESKLVLHL